MMVLLLGTHLYTTIRTRGIQRKLGLGLRMSVAKSKKSSGEISNFGALSIALAATMGTGNIIGVGTAVALGGPGAVFWCWITGVLGMATKYAESLLAVKYRVRLTDGSLVGGAMVVLDRVLHRHWLAVFFCVATVCAAFGIGNMNQSNSVSLLMQQSFGLPQWVTGVTMALLVGAVVFGGLKVLSRSCEVLVPFMAAFYIIGCLLLLVFNFRFVDEAVHAILVSAFTGEAVGGGLVGGGLMLTMRYGLARGMFSNEAGMGSTPIISAAAQTENAVKQALVATTAVFWDTVVVCALTGLVVVTSVMAYPDIDYSQGAVLTNLAFSKLHPMGGWMLTVALLIFSFSTILGWSYYAERCLAYLRVGKWLIAFRMIWLMAIFVGAVAHLQSVWDFADLANALMAIPNIVVVLLLSGVVARDTARYSSREHINDIDDEMQQ